MSQAKRSKSRKSLEELCDEAKWQSQHWRDRTAVITRAGSYQPEIIEAMRLPFIECACWAMFRPEPDGGVVMYGGELHRNGEIVRMDYREDAA
jgi:hypothetical protein